MRVQAGRRRALALPALWLVLLLVLGVAVAPPVGAEAIASIDDSSLAWGETTTVRGSGWLANQPVNIVLYPNAIALAKPKAGADGSFAASVTIPSGLGSSNQYRVGVQGLAADGTAAQAVLTVTIVGPDATVSVRDDDLGWGDVTTVHGAQFLPGSVVQVTLTPSGQVLAKPTVSGDGSFAVDVTIPSGIGSSNKYYLLVTGSGIDRLYKSLPIRVTVTGPRPTTEVLGRSFAWEEPATVRGTLWEPGSKVRISLAPNLIALGDAAVARDGTFEIEVRIPSDLAASVRYALLVSGTGDDGLFANVSHAITIDGPVPTSWSATTDPAAVIGSRSRLPLPRGPQRPHPAPGVRAVGEVTTSRAASSRRRS